MHLGNLNFLILFALILLLKTSVKAQTEVVDENKVDAPTCYNPNKQLGLCISIYDCSTLRYILQHKFRSLYSFVKASECPRGKGKPPFVCCTKDIKFHDMNSFKKHNERIIFPDEYERSKRFNGNLQNNDNEENIKTETVVTNDNDKIIENVNVTQTSSVGVDVTLNATETIAKAGTDEAFNVTQSTDETLNATESILSTDEVRNITGPTARTDEAFIKMKMTDTNSIEQLENVTTISKDDSFAKKFPRPPKCGSIAVANKIYGGNDAELGEFSWMVILEYRNLTTGKLIMDCSGSIINEFYVLTAAHCVQGEILSVNGKLESLRVGEHNTQTEEDCYDTNCLTPFRRIKIDAIIPHPDYNTQTYFGTRNQHDIALLRLKEPIKFNKKLSPVCLPNVEPLIELADETKFTVAGWGHNGTVIRTAIKQKVELPFVQHSKCRQFYAKKFYLADEQLCAGGQFRKDSCNGDSGGPLMRLHKHFWILEGIVSFGLSCGLERPGIYTNLRHYLDWIDEHVKDV